MKYESRFLELFGYSLIDDGEQYCILDNNSNVIGRIKEEYVYTNTDSYLASHMIINSDFISCDVFRKKGLNNNYYSYDFKVRNKYRVQLSNDGVILLMITSNDRKIEFIVTASQFLIYLSNKSISFYLRLDNRLELNYQCGDKAIDIDRNMVSTKDGKRLDNYLLDSSFFEGVFSLIDIDNIRNTLMDEVYEVLPREIDFISFLLDGYSANKLTSPYLERFIKDTDKCKIKKNIL